MLLVTEKTARALSEVLRSPTTLLVTPINVTPIWEPERIWARTHMSHTKSQQMAIASVTMIIRFGMKQSPNQLTDGGPSGTSEWPTAAVGPSYGGAWGSASMLRLPQMQ